MNNKEFLDYILNEGWQKSLNEDEILLEEVDLVLKEIGKDLEKDFDSKKGWESLVSRLDEDLKHDTESGFISSIKDRPAPIFNYSSSVNRAGVSRHVYIAAVFLLALLSASLMFNQFYLSSNKVSNADEPEFRDIQVEKGQRSHLVLSDGTNVILNAESHLQVPNEFSTDNREIQLYKGEAFFEVAHDPDRPFFIHSGDAVVEVLGTAFSVRTYPEDEAFQVAVKEGKVNLLSVQQNENLTLIENELGILSLSNQTLTSGIIDNLDLYTSWTEGYLQFKDTPLSKVALQIERRYDVEIKFASPGLKDIRLTASLKSRSLNNVLNVLTASLGIEYTEEDWQVITLSKGENKSSLFTDEVQIDI